MSLTFIYDFQSRIYTSLLEDKNITAVIGDAIYIGTTQDKKPPFMLLEIGKAEDVSVHHVALYQIDFRILAYAKDTHHNVLVKLSDYIIYNLSRTSINKLFDKYQIDGIKANSIHFDCAKDLVLNRLIINYKAAIKAI